MGASMERLRKGRRFSVGFVMVTLVALGLGVALTESEPSAAIALPVGLGLFVLPLVLGSPTYRRLTSLHRNGVHVVGRVASISDPKHVTVGKPRRDGLRWTTVIEFTRPDGHGGRATFTQVVLRGRRPHDPDHSDAPPPFPLDSAVDLVVEPRVVHAWRAGVFLVADRID
jgi:hypothetical protein